MNPESGNTCKAEITRDEHGNITIRPPPAVLSLSALRATGNTTPLDEIVDSLRAAGVKVELCPEKQAEYDALKRAKEAKNG